MLQELIEKLFTPKECNLIDICPYKDINNEKCKTDYFSMKDCPHKLQKDRRPVEEKKMVEWLKCTCGKEYPVWPKIGVAYCGSCGIIVKRGEE